MNLQELIFLSVVPNYRKQRLALFFFVVPNLAFLPIPFLSLQDITCITL